MICTECEANRKELPKKAWLMCEGCAAKTFIFDDEKLICSDCSEERFICELCGRRTTKDLKPKNEFPRLAFSDRAQAYRAAQREPPAPAQKKSGKPAKKKIAAQPAAKRTKGKHP